MRAGPGCGDIIRKKNALLITNRRTLNLEARVVILGGDESKFKKMVLGELRQHLWRQSIGSVLGCDSSSD